jgi:diguanylate cyclase (GGDEF)-like protein
MPDMDGYEVCRRLKANPATVDIPVIFLTAKNDESAETQGLELGAVDYVVKPFSVPIVRVRVRTHVELKRNRDQLLKLSACDGLTGIPNRRRFDEVYDLEWRRAARSGEELALIMIDIDHFKAYNDTLGHMAGDDCIRGVAAVLSRCVRRAADLVARYGGEEFVALLPSTDAAGGLSVAEEMRSAVQGLGLAHPGSPVGPHVTVSLGVAAGAPAASDAGSKDRLIQRADSALYLAKTGGRNRVAGDAESAPGAGADAGAVTPLRAA